MIYKCEICRTEYPTEKECFECENQPLDKPTVSVGDIVTLAYGFSWYDGDKNWVINPENEYGRNEECPNGHGNCFSECCTMGFYYVVTAIKNHEHRVQYHVFTKAMTGKNGHHGGYIYDERHINPKLVKNPPKKVVASSKDLIGKESSFLL